MCTAAQTVLDAAIREAAPAVRERVLAEAGGNPLALLELPGGLSDDQLTGDAPLPGAIPLTPRLQAVFRQRIDRLPEGSQSLLLILAADDTGDAATVVRAAAHMELHADALDPAETADLIRTSYGTLTFRHPLVRSALYDGATMSQRQRVHAALAAVLDGEEHSDRRVWHQAMATWGADEEVAAALEASARRSQLRAAHSSAASAFLRAAELSMDQDRRVSRVAAAAAAAWDAGQPDRAREAIAQALPAASGELRVRLLQLSGAIEGRCGSVPAALPQLLEGANATDDASLRLEMLVDAAEAAELIGRLETVVEICEQGGSVPATTARDRMMAALLSGFARVFSGDPRAARPLLEGVMREADVLDDPRALTLAASAASVSDLGGAGLRYANRAVESARRRGLLSLLPQALEQQAYELAQTSSFELAYAAAEEGYRLSLDVGHGRGWHLINMARAETVWGRADDAQRHLEEALAIGRQTGNSFLIGTADWMLGFLELAVGRPVDAADRMLAVTDLGDPGVNPLVALPAIPDAVEAATRSGRDDEARRAAGGVCELDWGRARGRLGEPCSRAARRCSASGRLTRRSARQSRGRKRCHRFSARARSWYTASGCAASGGARTPEFTCGRRLSCFAASASRRSRTVPRPS